VWLATEIAKAPKEEYIVVAPTYKLLTRATLPALLDTFRDTQLQGELLVSKGVYMLPQGGKVWLGTADRPESLEGGQYRAAWLDEAGQMKYMAWVAIQARLGLKRGRALLTTTPYGMNWLYKFFYQLWRKGNANYDVVGFKSTDNPLYPKAEVERARAELSDELFAMRYEGAFHKMEGLLYPSFDDNNMCAPFRVPTGWDCRGGCDFGYINPHVNLKGALDQRTDMLYVYEEYYASRTELKDIAETMRDVPFRGDPAGLREIEELRRTHGIDIKSGEVNKLLKIAAVNARVRTNRLKVFNTCVNTLDEVDIYHIDPRTGKPAKVDDHCMDALAEMVWFFDSARMGKSKVHLAGLPKGFSAFSDKSPAPTTEQVAASIAAASVPPEVREAQQMAKKSKLAQLKITTPGGEEIKPADEETTYAKKKSKVYIP